MDGPLEWTLCAYCNFLPPSLTRDNQCAVPPSASCQAGSDGTGALLLARLLYMREKADVYHTPEGGRFVILADLSLALNLTAVLGPNSKPLRLFLLFSPFSFAPLALSYQALLTAVQPDYVTSLKITSFASHCPGHSHQLTRTAGSLQQTFPVSLRQCFPASASLRSMTSTPRISQPACWLGILGSVRSTSFSFAPYRHSVINWGWEGRTNGQ